MLDSGTTTDGILNKIKQGGNMGELSWIEYVKLLPVYCLFIGTFGQASSEKFLSGGTPDWFKNQFQSTFVGRLPGGATVPYYLIACLEAAVVLLFLLSLGHMEFLPAHDVSFLKAALVLSLFAFFLLGFGLRISGDYQGAANLFAYFGVAFLIFIYVERFLGT